MSGLLCDKDHLLACPAGSRMRRLPHDIVHVHRRQGSSYRGLLLQEEGPVLIKKKQQQQKLCISISPFFRSVNKYDYKDM